MYACILWTCQWFSQTGVVPCSTPSDFSVEISADSDISRDIWVQVVAELFAFDTTTAVHSTHLTIPDGITCLFFSEPWNFLFREKTSPLTGSLRAVSTSVVSKFWVSHLNEVSLRQDVIRGTRNSLMGCRWIFRWNSQDKCGAPRIFKRLDISRQPQW